MGHDVKVGAYYLVPKFIKFKSFHNKAIVHVQVVNEYGKKYRKASLYVNKNVIAYTMTELDNPEARWAHTTKTFSKAETMYAKEFLKQEGFKADNIKQMTNDYSIFLI